MRSTQKASLLVIGPANTLIDDYSQFELTVNKILCEWAKPLGCIIMPDCINQETRCMASQYARERNCLCLIVNGKWNEYGNAAASIRDRHIMTRTSHAIIFSANQSRQTQVLYERVVREGVPFVKMD